MYVTRQQDVDPEEAGDAPLFYGGTAIVLLTVVMQPQLRRLTYFKKVR